MLIIQTHSRAVLPRLNQLLVVLALTLSLGAHWLFLQTVAWVGMVATYSQTASLHEALNKAFDGQHPCSLCKLVRDGKAKEQKRNALKTMTKLDMAVTAREVLVTAPVPFPLVATVVKPVSAWRDSPPTPPPRPA